MTWEDELEAAWAGGAEPAGLRASIERIVSDPEVPEGVGRSDEAIAVLIDVLAGHVTRYRASARAYAEELRAT